MMIEEKIVNGEINFKMEKNEGFQGYKLPLPASQMIG
jgi:hypothetical protein